MLGMLGILGTWGFILAGGVIVIAIVAGCLFLELLAMECLCPMCSDLCDA